MYLGSALCCWYQAVPPKKDGDRSPHGTENYPLFVTCNQVQSFAVDRVLENRHEMRSACLMKNTFLRLKSLSMSPYI